MYFTYYLHVLSVDSPPGKFPWCEIRLGLDFPWSPWQVTPFLPAGHPGDMQTAAQEEEVCSCSKHIVRILLDPSLSMDPFTGVGLQGLIQDLRTGWQMAGPKNR